LLKDVPGYFTADPNHAAGAAHIPEIDYARALEMARDGCDLVQVAALETAQRAGLTLVIRSAHDPRETTVAPGVRPGSERGQSTLRSDSTFWDELRAENALLTGDCRP
jgi:aspartokinase